MVRVRKPYALEIQPVDPTKKSEVADCGVEFGIAFGNQYLEID